MALRLSGNPEPLASGDSGISPATSRSVASRRALLIVVLTAMVDLLAISFSYAAAKATRIETLSNTKPLILATIPAWLIVFYVYGLYSRRQVLEPSARIPRLLSAITVCIFLMVVVAFFLHLEPSRTWLVTLWVFSTVVVILGRLAVLRITHQLNQIRWLGLRTLMVGVNGEAHTLARVLNKKRHLGYEVLGFVAPEKGVEIPEHAIATLDTLRQTVIDLDVAVLFIAGSDSGADVLTQVDQAVSGLGVRIRTSLGLPHLAASRVVVQPVDGMAMLAVERVRPAESHLLIKRALDVTLAGIGVVVGLPALIVIAVAVRFSGEGPIIFSQKRVGYEGELFTMYKFRTMVKDAEHLRPHLEIANEADGTLFKMRLDPRLTRVGRHLRQLGLDELPQLFNVLIGDMSLVGPRPALPAERDQWSPEVALRLRAKPGLTGLWQVSGRHELAFEDYVRYDLFYVENWSLGLDLQIIARTIPALLSRAGSY
jgi:exopolysaccharide biosynthesis polyprenyl glycosylphosphotransferase